MLERDGEDVVLHPPVSGPSRQPACATLQDMFQLFAAYAFFGMTVSGRAAAFDLDEMQDGAAAGDEIHFIAAMTEIAFKDEETLFFEPLSRQSFATRSYFCPRHHSDF